MVIRYDLNLAHDFAFLFFSFRGHDRMVIGMTRNLETLILHKNLFYIKNSGMA